MSARTPDGRPLTAYQRLRHALVFLVRVFFRRLEVVGLENVPADRGGILVAWHPNGLVDPTLVLASFPRQVVFGARHGLFRIPLLGRLMRAMGTVPIYRRQDLPGGSVDDQRRRNDASLDLLADRIAQGSFSALFPEGITHDAPFLQELKTGAARLYYRARTRTPAAGPPPVIIPVGIHYDHKRVFRSCALVVFHPPLELPPELDVSPPADADPERVRELARELTEDLERELRAVILETESWQVHRLLHRARKLVRAERAHRAAATLGEATLDEKVVGFMRIWTGYRELLRTRPAEVARLRRRIERYDGYLRGLRIDDEELDHPPPVLGRRLGLLLLLQGLAVFVLLPPLLLIGLIVNLPPALLLSAAARAFVKQQSAASFKLGGGIVLFPLTWAIWGWLAMNQAVRFLPVAPSSPWLAAAWMVTLSIAGGVVMVAYLGWAEATVHAIRVRLTRSQRARALRRLGKDRAKLCDDLLAMAVGIELPGVVHADGRISRNPAAAAAAAGLEPSTRP
jgi:1-acyl-sn-glycerol-3-phosphate acyltransferase